MGRFSDAMTRRYNAKREQEWLDAFTTPEAEATYRELLGDERYEKEVKRMKRNVERAGGAK